MNCKEFNKRSHFALIIGDTDKCSDISKHCSKWVSKKECTTRSDFMAQNCKKSCEMCGPGKFYVAEWCTLDCSGTLSGEVSALKSV